MEGRTLQKSPAWQQCISHDKKDQGNKTHSTMEMKVFQGIYEKHTAHSTHLLLLSIQLLYYYADVNITMIDLILFIQCCLLKEFVVLSNFDAPILRFWPKHNTLTIVSPSPVHVRWYCIFVLYILIWLLFTFFGFVFCFYSLSLLFLISTLNTHIEYPSKQFLHDTER